VVIFMETLPPARPRDMHKHANVWWSMQLHELCALRRSILLVCGGLKLRHSVPHTCM
jgi:hypothetical protein